MYRRVIIALILVNLCLITYFYTRPYSFYKVIAIRSVSDFTSLVETDTINQDDYTLSTISKLPEKRGTIYTHNKEKRKQMFLEGYGNCSNQAVAMGTLLSERNKTFQVVHLMPIYQFLEGGGHTVLQTTFKDSLMIFDLLGRSILKKNNHLINYNDLDSLASNSALQPITFDILNPKRAKVETYYNPDSNKNIIIGIVPDQEYKKFYSFTKHLYTPKKETRLTQAFFYSITTLFNRLPHIYVQERDIEKLNQNKKFIIDRFLSFTLIINTWIIFSIIFVLTLYKIARHLKK